MCGSLVSHDELGPENSQVQRLNGAVQVYLRQLHYLLFVTTEKNNVQANWNPLISTPQDLQYILTDNI